MERLLREPSPSFVAAVRTACAVLPEAYEEPAWVGTRWRIRKRTFAHVLAIADPAGEHATLTFRSPDADVLRHVGHPFYFLGWGRNAIGMLLDDQTDWTEVRELLVDSYCLLAPKKLVAQVDRPPG